MTTTGPVPGWYDDPEPDAPAGRYRFWDGSTWTDHVTAHPGPVPPAYATTAPAPAASATPLGATPVATTPVATAAPSVPPWHAMPTAPPPPPETGRTRRPLLVVAAAVVAIALIVGVGGFLVTRSSKSYPAAWDPRVAPIADRVSALRGLDFQHPVPVRYLPDAEFQKRVAVDDGKLSAEDRRRYKDLEATFLALGLIDGKTDLVQALDTVKKSGVLAFYDPDSEEVVVRGVGPLDPSRKATLAHELTHVLQDQHFDLRQAQHDVAESTTQSSAALTALVEGDAERIKFDYLKGLPKADRDAYDAAESASGDATEDEMASAPEIVKVEVGKPYTFGPEVLKVLAAKGGNRAVDDALRRHDVTDLIFLDPGAALEDRDVTEVGAPKIDQGAERLGKAGSVGAFDLYALLASRIDRQEALDAADTWAGDQYVAYRKGLRPCVRATFASRNAADAGTLGRALDAWAAAKPGATVARDAAHRRTTLTSCDQGATVAPDAARIRGAVSLLANRDDLLAVLLAQHIPIGVSECAGRRLVKEPAFVALVDAGADASPTAGETQQIRQTLMRALDRCRQ